MLILIVQVDGFHLVVHLCKSAVCVFPVMELMLQGCISTLLHWCYLALLQQEHAAAMLGHNTSSQFRLIVTILLLFIRPPLHFAFSLTNPQQAHTPSLSLQRKLMILFLWKSTGIRAPLCSLSTSDRENKSLKQTAHCRNELYNLEDINSHMYHA